MPRATRKRNSLNPRKSQLRFVEQPRNGSRHDYGAHLRSAINPKISVSHTSRQGVPGDSWVSPQFTSLEDTSVRCGGRRRKKTTSNHHHHASTSNKTALSIQARRPTVCKYPALLFETPRCPRKSITAHVRDFPEVRPSRSHEDGMVPRLNRDDVPDTTPGAEIRPEPNMSGNLTTPRSDPGRASSSTLAPPHIETPEMSRSQPAASSSLLGLLFSTNQPRTPPRTESLLVRDTPENDYGLKVTWRRRKKLMRLLTERGQLLHADVLINRGGDNDCN
ncbi:RAD1-interacting nuclear orphan protein 1 [Silurus meridionalis]|nr:RAD1-interacting nuclear orphan protein 1 [Silurus meridionalis]